MCHLGNAQMPYLKPTATTSGIYHPHCQSYPRSPIKREREFWLGLAQPISELRERVAVREIKTAWSLAMLVLLWSVSENHSLPDCNVICQRIKILIVFFNLFRLKTVLFLFLFNLKPNKLVLKRKLYSKYFKLKQRIFF